MAILEDNIHDYKGSLALDLGVTGAPETFLIINGQVVAHYQGEVNEIVWNEVFLPIIDGEGYFKMKIIFLSFFLSANLFSDSIYNFENAEDEIRFNTLVKEIRCPKCTSGSLSSSNAPISQDLKLKIVEMINENKSDEEIKDYVSTRFGVDSLYEPALTEDTYFLWFAPFILLLITLTILFFKKTE